MKKDEIRRNMIEKRNSYSTDEILEKSSKIYGNLLNLPEFQEADYCLLYADFNNEVMTRDIFDECIRRKKKVFFPKCTKNDMNFYQVVSAGELRDGMYGIKEPINLNIEYKYNEKINTLMIVPGVAFDIRGYRVGYGKGYYDRFLQDKPLVNKVGLSFSYQLTEEVPNDEYDIKMDKLVTEELVYSFLRI